MKNKTGKIIGFVLGMAGFLVLFRMFVLVRIPPEDEIPPGAVMFTAVLAGLFFAFIGNLLQDHFGRKQHSK